MAELIQTEKAYVNDLETCIKVMLHLNACFPAANTITHVFKNNTSKTRYFTIVMPHLTSHILIAHDRWF